MSDRWFEEKHAHLVWDALIEEGVAREIERDIWIRVMCGEKPSNEYRINGPLGLGGKIHITRDSWFVTCYDFDKDTQRSDLIHRADKRLAQLKGQADDELAQSSTETESSSTDPA